MERLTSYKNETNREMICRYEDCDVCEEYCPHMQEDNCSCLQEVLEKLGQYEDAEEQGLLLRLPCKVGDTVYCIEKRRTKCTAYDEEYRESSCLGCECACDSKVYYEVKETEAYGVGWILSNKKEFGKLIFLTKEEAEQKLASMQKGE